MLGYLPLTSNRVRWKLTASSASHIVLARCLSLRNFVAITHLDHTAIEAHQMSQSCKNNLNSALLIPFHVAATRLHRFKPSTVQHYRFTVAPAAFAMLSIE